MKKFIATFFFLLFGWVALHAQQKKTTISILNEKGEPVHNVTALLFRLPDSTLIFKKVIPSDFSFYFDGRFSYLLRLSSINMLTLDHLLQGTDTNTVNTFTLKKRQEDLGNVTVVSARRSFLKEEDDKTIVDAAALTISSTNAFEVVEKTPGAIIDQDGNVYLTSTTPATVFINGKEMKLSGADLASLLKSMPANSVSKIEILRNPSAKYDAASSGGIINIVLKKGVKLGNSGSVNAGYFQGVYATETSGFTFNKNGDKYNSYVSYQFTNRGGFEKLYSLREFPADSSFVDQHSYTKYPSLNHYFTTGIDYAINDKWNLGYDTRVSYTVNRNKANNDIAIGRQTNSGLFSQNNSKVSNDNESFYWFNSMNLKHKIDTSGSEWNSSIEYWHYQYHNLQQYRNEFQLPLVRYISGEGTNNNKKGNFTFQTDLTLKLPKKYTLETGIKLNTGISNNQADFFKDTGNQIRVVDGFQTNTYEYRETIGAAYLQMSKTFFGFTIKPGLRFEYTDISGHQILPGDTSFSIRRNDVFPYLYIKHKLFKMFDQTIMGSAIFRKSIRRPYYESLNPYPRLVDQYLYDVGNPALRPQFTSNFELNATFNDIPVFAAGINDTRDIFTNVVYQDNNTRIAYRTFDNLGKNREYYFRLVGGVPPGKKYFFYLGGVYNYNEYRGSFQNQPFNYNRGSFTFFTFHEYKITKKLTANMQGFFRTRALQNLYELNTFGGMFISFNQSLSNKKVNVIISLSDVWRTNQVKFTFNRNNQQISGSRVNDTRRLGITIRYNFGFKPKEEKKNSFEAPQENKEN